MNRTAGIAALVVLVLLAGWFLWPSPILRQPELLVVTQGSDATGKGVLRMPIGKTLDGEYDLRAWVDWNGDSSFSDNELVAADIPVTPKKGDSQSVAVALPAGATAGSSYPVRVAVFRGTDTSSAESFDGTVTAQAYDIGDVLDMSTVTKPDSAMKGGQTVVRNAPPPAAAKPEGVPTTFANDTPDIKQRKDECAPTSAANSIIRMAGDNGKIDAIPRDPYELVGMLKKEMGWTFQNGVLIEDFSRGKDYVAKQLGLPIHSETYSGDSASVLDRIEDVLNGGGGTEMRLKQVVDGRSVGGHMVTVTNVIRNGQQTSVQIHDPLSPGGTDTYEVDSRTGELIGYPYMRGTLVITTGFLQRWDSGPPSIIDDLEPTHRQTVKAIRYKDHYIPLSEVYVEEPGNCGAHHYHASKGGVAKALDGAMVSDEAPQHCGYGKVDETPVYDCSTDGAACTPVPEKKKK